MPAVALTDRTNLFGLVKFYSACRDAGIKAIIGADIDYEDGDGVHRCTLLVACEAGYRNLLRLVSRAYTGAVGNDPGKPWPGRSRRYPGRRRGAAGAIGQRQRCGCRTRQRRNGDAPPATLAQGVRAIASIWAVVRTGRPRRRAFRGRRRDAGGGAECAGGGQQRRAVSAPRGFRGARDAGCASKRAASSTIHAANGATASSNICARRRKCASCSTICRRRWDNSIEIARRCSYAMQLGTYYLPSYPVPAGATLGIRA